MVMPALVPGLMPLARVPIPEGTFAMGSTSFDEAQPVTDVTVSAFEISETKVTIGQYREYLKKIGENRWTLAVENPETGDFTVVDRGKTRAEVQEAYFAMISAKMSPAARIQVGGFMVFEVTDPDILPQFRESLDQPMVKIDWWEMLAFAAAHGGDLPTEAECERVMRGRSGKDEYGTSKGDSLELPDGERLAQFDTDGTLPVRSYPANSWGVYDASGNVETWTKDSFAPSYEGRESKDPRGPRHGRYRVLRGGSYYSYEDGLHAACRTYARPHERSKDRGGSVVWRSLK